jgi:uncharacterized SAM-dependent methyltransferase
MHIVSMRNQVVRIRGLWFRFSAGETIHTENSYKYSIGQFQDISGAAGWLPGRVWTDKENLFSVHELISSSVGTAVIPAAVNP